MMRTHSAAAEIGRTPFPDDVKTAASLIYGNLRGSDSRGTKRLKAICFCIYQAYIDMKNPQDIILVGKKLGLSSSESDNSITIFSRKLSDPSSHGTGYIDVCDLVRCYCQESVLNITQSSVDEIIGLWKLIVSKSPRIKERKPRPLVSGLIWTYVKRNDPEALLTAEFADTFGQDISAVSNVSDSLTEILYE